MKQTPPFLHSTNTFNDSMKRNTKKKLPHESQNVTNGEDIKTKGQSGLALMVKRASYVLVIVAIGAGFLSVSTLPKYPFSSHHEDECELFLAPSLIPNSGRGVFAGKSFDTGATIDKSNSVSIPMEPLLYHQVGLNEYL